MSLTDTLIYATNGSGSVAALQHDGSSSLKVAITSNTSGTGDASASNQTTMIGHLSAIETSVGGTLLVDGSAYTQPVDIVSSTGTISVDGSGFTQPVSAVSLPLPSGASTSANQSTIVGLLSGTLTVDGSGSTQPISAVSLPLPSGASTSANQSTAITLLSSIDTEATALNGKITQGNASQIVAGSLQQVLIYGKDSSGDLHTANVSNSGDLDVEIADFVKGQALMSASFPVVISSDQSTIEVNTDKTSATSTLWSGATLGAGTSNNTSGVLDFQDYSVLQIIGNTTNTNDPIYIEFSTDNITYYRDGMNTIYPDFTSGDFVVSFPDVACRYIRAVKDNTDVSAETITLKAAVRKN